MILRKNLCELEESKIVEDGGWKLQGHESSSVEQWGSQWHRLIIFDGKIMKIIRDGSLTNCMRRLWSRSF